MKMSKQTAMTLTVLILLMVLLNTKILPAMPKRKIYKQAITPNRKG